MAPDGVVQIILDAYINSIRWGNAWAAGLARYDSWWEGQKRSGARVRERTASPLWRQLGSVAGGNTVMGRCCTMTLG